MRASEICAVMLFFAAGPLAGQECIGMPGESIEGIVAVRHERAQDARIYGLEVGVRAGSNLSLTAGASSISDYGRFISQGVDENGPFLGGMEATRSFDVRLAVGPVPGACLITGYSREDRWKITKYYVDQSGRCCTFEAEEDLDMIGSTIPIGIALGRSLRAGPLLLTPHAIGTYLHQRISSERDHDWAGALGMGARYQWLTGKITLYRSLSDYDAPEWLAVVVGAEL